MKNELGVSNTVRNWRITRGQNWDLEPSIDSNHDKDNHFEEEVQLNV